MKVKCPSCKRIYYETNETYDPNHLESSMIDLVEPWKSRGWGKFGWSEMENVPVSLMLCVGCGAPLAPGGKLLVVDEIKCPICGRICKSKLGLNSHMRKHRGKVESNQHPA